MRGSLPQIQAATEQLKELKATTAALLAEV
jgi:hypothetical protein